MKIVEKDEFKVVGLAIETSPFKCAKEAKPLWNEFIKKYKQISNRVEDDFCGVCFVTGECDFKYIACVKVSNFKDIPKGMIAETVPKSKYAVFTHKGKMSTLGNTYARIYEKDMPKSGLTQKEFWFELYDHRYEENSDSSEMDIYVAVK